MPVLPARKANELVATAAGKNPRPVVLHFWATWCEACRDEFPALRPQLTGLPSRGVGVLLVSIDRPEDREKAEKMLADFRLLRVHAVLLDAPDPAPVARAVGEPTWDGHPPGDVRVRRKGKLRQELHRAGRPEQAEDGRPRRDEVRRERQYG